MTYPDVLLSVASEQPFPLLFATISGAHLYGFPSTDSDYDIRGVHVLPPQECLGLQLGPATLQSSEVRDGREIDLVTHDAKKFFNLLLKPNGYVLEQLLSPLVVLTSPEHGELRSLASGCITRHHAHHYRGFARNQWKVFEKERPPRIKPLLYLYRVLLTGIYLMESGEVEANLERLLEKSPLPFVSELMERKMAGAEKSVLEGAEIAFHEREYSRLIGQLEDASAASALPDYPASGPALHDLLLRIRLGRT